MKSKIIYSMILASFMSTTSMSLAASATGNLNLSGSIQDTVSIIVTPSANASSLNLNTNAVDVQVATAAESSNAANGYQISARSSNSGKLVHTTDSTQSIAYTLKYGASGALSLSASDQVVKSQLVGGSYSSIMSDVSISYSGVVAGSKKAGSYVDTVTFTIAAL